MVHCINLPTDTDLANDKGFVLEHLPVLEYYKDLKSNVYFFLQDSRCIIDRNAILLYPHLQVSYQVSFVWRAERDINQCGWCESNKPTHSDTAGQEGKGATVHSGVRVRSRTVSRICVPGLSFRFGAVSGRYDESNDMCV